MELGYELQKVKNLIAKINLDSFPREDCAICLEIIPKPFEIVCGHGNFHEACIKKCLKTTKKCPICQA